MQDLFTNGLNGFPAGVSEQAQFRHRLRLQPRMNGRTGLAHGLFRFEDLEDGARVRTKLPGKPPAHRGLAHTETPPDLLLSQAGVAQRNEFL